MTHDAANHLASAHVSGNAGPIALENTSSIQPNRAVALALSALSPTAPLDHTRAPPHASVANHITLGACVIRRSPGFFFTRLAVVSPSSFAPSLVPPSRVVVRAALCFVVVCLAVVVAFDPDRARAFAPVVMLPVRRRTRGRADVPVGWMDGSMSRTDGWIWLDGWMDGCPGRMDVPMDGDRRDARDGRDARDASTPARCVDARAMRLASASTRVALRSPAFGARRRHRASLAQASMRVAPPNGGRYACGARTAFARSASASATHDDASRAHVERFERLERARLDAVGGARGRDEGGGARIAIRSASFRHGATRRRGTNARGDEDDERGDDEDDARGTFGTRGGNGSDGDDDERASLDGTGRGPIETPSARAERLEAELRSEATTSSYDEDADEALEDIDDDDDDDDDDASYRTP